MKRKSFRMILLLVVLMLFAAAFSVSAREQGPQLKEAQATAVAGSGLVLQPKGVTADAVYIVRLQDAPLASYRGGLQGLNATSPAATSARKLDVSSPASVAYRDYLTVKQDSFLSAAAQVLGHSPDVVYRYDVALNGVAMVLSPQEASAIAKQPGVASVQRDFWRYPQTDATPDFIGATGIWDGSAVEGAGTKAEGVIVGVIDTGIWPEHPSFADDGSYPAPPGSWGGECEAPGDGSDPLTCNNKLIGARYFLDGYNSAVGGFDGLFLSARDDDGHGTHTASTAAGNENVAVTLLGVDRGTVSGIAPRAYVAAYRALGPQGGVGSDLIAAIDAAVADGVDVINYSIGGGSSDPWQDGDALAFLAARDAGIFVATSASNSGPDAATVGSPADAPWITAVGASTSNRQFISDITLDGPGSPPTGLYGASVTDGVTDFNLVDAEGIPDEEGDSSGMCLNPFPAGTFEATDVVLCERGVIARVLRGDYVQAGGGGAVILYNAVPDQDIDTDNYVIPAVHVSNEFGLAIKNYLSGKEGQVMLSFTLGEKAYAESDSRVTADMMAAFSSRGPNLPSADLVKPNVTAPGVQILAGASPEHDGDGAQGQLFQAIGGTSMSSPHVAGAAALVAAVNPDWTPAEIESALMTTATMDVVKEDGTTPADAFDMGGGRIVVPMAANAALIMDESEDNYLAADPALGGDPKSLNLASLGNGACVTQCSWQRTVENATEQEITWDASVDGLTGSVEPASFTLAPGATQMFTATVDVSGLEAGVWAFGTLMLEPQTEDVPASHMAIAINPDTGSLPDQIEIHTGRDAGSYLIEDVTAIAISDMTIMTYGLEPAQDSTIHLAQDATNDDPYDDMDQVWYMTFDVPQDTVRFVNEILESSAPDADMYVGMDSNGNGMPDEDEEVCASTTGSWNEYCNVDMPEAGDWWVLVQNWASSEAEMDRIVLATAVVPAADAGNMTIDAPDSVPALEPFDVTVFYNLEDAYEGQAWYGAFSLGSAPANAGDVGMTRVNLYREQDDVVKSADKMSAMPGDTVEFTIHVNTNLLNQDVEYTIEDIIPDGLTYVPGSATASAGDVDVVNGVLTWTGVMPSPQSVAPTYDMSTSETDELCDTGFDGYVNLEDFDISTNPDVSGDTAAFGFFSDGDPINFYGQEFESMVITDDGFAVFDFDNNYGGEPWVPQAIPDADLPNNLAAMLWQDMEIIYDEAANRGVSAATAGPEVMVVEYDGIQLFEDPANTYDFEIIMTRSIDDAPGAYEIVFAYDNLSGTLAGPLTIGVENEAGNGAIALVNNGSAAGVIDDGFMVCFDANVPATDVTITYEVTVDEDADLGLIRNMATSTTDNPGSEETVAHSGVYVGTPVFFPAIHIKD